MDTNINLGSAAVKIAIENALGTKNFNITYENFNNCILVTNANNDNEDQTYVWIRILGNPSTGVQVDIANATFSTYLRHRGLFTRMVNEIAKLDCVNLIIIGNVVTAEMYNWCIKRKLDLASDGISFWLNPHK